MSWTDLLIISTDLSTVTNPCGAYITEIWDFTTGSEVAPDTSVFTIDATSLTKTIDVTTSDLAKIKTYYTMEVKVYYPLHET